MITPTIMTTIATTLKYMVFKQKINICLDNYYMTVLIKKSLKIPQGVIRHHNQRRTDNIMTNSKKTDKTIVDEILHKKLKIGQPKAH